MDGGAEDELKLIPTQEDRAKALCYWVKREQVDYFQSGSRHIYFTVFALAEAWTPYFAGVEGSRQTLDARGDYFLRLPRTWGLQPSLQG